MTTLREIMTTDVLTLSPGASLREAAELLDTQHIGGVPVVDRGEVVGVLSVSDLLDYRTDEPGTFGDMRRRATELADLPAETAPDPERATDYFAELWENGGEGSDWESDLEALRDEALEGAQVAEVMSRGVIALGPGATAEEAAELMLERDIHRVLVLEDGRLAGLVTMTDLVRALSARD